MKSFNRRIIAWFLTLFMLFSGFFNTEAASQSQCLSQHKMINSVAHRGYSRTAPENTLPAYRLAKEMGFNYVECDVAYTADGVPVLLHLDDIKHTSNGWGSVSSFTYAQLLNYDFGSWKDPSYKGTKIPTFEEFVALCAEIGLHPYIELKESGKFNKQKIQQLVNILEKYNMLHQCTWITFIHDYLFYVLECNPYARIGLLWPYDINQSVINKANSLKTSTNKVFFNANYDNLTASGIQLAQKNNFPLEVYTINSTDKLLNLPSYITGVTSDYLVAHSVISNLTCIITPPNCTEQGYSTYSCSNCDYKTVVNYTSALGHKYGSNGLCERCESEGNDFEYYVYDTALGGSDNNNGLTENTAIATLEKAIKLASSAGADADDTVTLHLKGNVTLGGNINNNAISTNWEVLSSHTFKLFITSQNESAVIGDGQKNILFGGDICFNSIKINTGIGYKSLCFVGNNVQFNSTTFTSNEFDLILGTRANHTANKAVSASFDTLHPKIFVGNSYQTITYNQKFTLNLTEKNPINASSTILALSSNNGKTIFNSGADIINRSPHKLTFQNAEKVEIGQNGYLNIINTSSNKITLANIPFTSSALNKVWVINTSSASSIASTNKSGVFTVESGYVATATAVDGNTTTSTDRKLELDAGQYDVTFKLCDNHIYNNEADTNCNLCGAKRTICQHSWSEYVSDNNATCEKDGSETSTCTLCNATMTRTAENSALCHSFTNYIYNKNATCTQDGTKTAACDNGCGKINIIAAEGTSLGHDWKTATCTEPKTCKICGTTEGTALGHNNVTSTKKATYAKSGSVVVKCSVCGVIKSTKTITKLKPKNTKVSKITAARKSLKIKIKKQKSVKGYQIQYSLKKNFKSAKKITLKKNSLTTKTIKKLKSKKIYYVRVRTFNTEKGKKYYSAWSKAVKKKTR